MLCQDCKKKPNCVKLCPAAEKWVNQDHVALREIPKPQWLLDRISIKAKPAHRDLSNYFSHERVEFPFLTPIQNKILHLFYFEGLTYNEIAFKMKIQRKAVDNQLCKAKEKIKGFSSDYRGD